jgi:hypothetical protein
MVEVLPGFVVYRVSRWSETSGLRANMRLTWTPQIVRLPRHPDESLPECRDEIEWEQNKISAYADAISFAQQ